MKRKIEVIASASSPEWANEANEMAEKGYTLTHVVTRSSSNKVWGIFELKEDA